MQFLGLTEIKGKEYMVTEYLSGGTLQGNFDEFLGNLLDLIQETKLSQKQLIMM